ncbi:MAG: hypothetical protein EOP87_05570 [Verrucomicrobiaceae bacterium]|nr:MAG: hypothetical protein EOP87_05570 [Verrucomicrobiaceae bacterium]
MKPEPDPQADGKRPKPRRSFAKDNRVEDALEKDLWDLDEPAAVSPPSSPDPVEEAEPPAPEAGKDQESRAPLPITPRTTRRDLVFMQSPAKKRPPHQPSADEAEGEGSRSTAKETAGEFSNRIITSSVSDDAFMDLDNSPAGDSVPTEAPGTSSGTGENAESGASREFDTDEETEEPADDIKDVPAAAPDPAKAFSKVERMGLIGFLVLIAGGILFFFAYSVNKLPDDKKPLTPGDLPIGGKMISADEIRSYWREPDLSGGEAVRRGTLLVPVVELGVSGGPGAVRILFRDSDGAIVGDGVTRAVKGEQTVTISATAGFDDQGMFAAYRTGETKPWKIEVYEGPSENAAGDAFKKLFEIPISTQRR